MTVATARKIQRYAAYVSLACTVAGIVGPLIHEYLADKGTWDLWLTDASEESIEMGLALGEFFRNNEIGLGSDGATAWSVRG